jgi:hypothetical protein
METRAEAEVGGQGEIKELPVKYAMHNHVTLLLICATVLAVGSQSLGDEPARESSSSAVHGKKIIKLFGWDKPDTAYVRANITTMEATHLDGVGINLMPDPPLADAQWGGQGNYVWFTSMPASREQYQRAVDDLKATPFTRFTDNFSLMAMRGPGGIPDWFDDDFAVVCDNARVQAWACREGGLKGIVIDVEDAAVLDYTDDRRRRATFDQYAARVHQCAKRFMEAMVREYPDIVIILSHGYHTPMMAVHRHELPLEDVRYALLPAFIDGLLDGAGDRATVIDGCEDTYPLMCYESYARFHRYADLSMRRLSRLPAAQHDRLRKAVAIWPSFPSDFDDQGIADAAPDSGRYNFNADRFAHALYNAMHASDRYVWLWNGANCWWTPAISTYAQRVADGRIHLLPASFIDAVRRARIERMDLAWSPGPPLGAVHDAAPAGEGVDSDGILNNNETLMTLSDDWWFIASPDDCEPRNHDAFASWTRWYQPGFAESDMGWHQVASASSIGDEGVSYYRCRFEVPRHLRGRSLRLMFNGVVGKARVWGAATGLGPNRLLAEHDKAGPFIVDAKGAAVPGRECVVTVEVSNWRGRGVLQGPVRLVAPLGESPTPPVTERCVLLDLSFDQLHGETTPDDSGFDHTAKVIGAQLVDGRFGKALLFDGQGDAVIVPDSGVFDVPDGALTWELWFKADGPVVDAIVYHNLITKTPGYTHGLVLNYLTQDNAVIFMQSDPSKSPRVDGVRLYNYALSADEVQQRYRGAAGR